jgi:hypothetical protein
MSNSAKYLKLWQQKRSELHINDDAQHDWLEMRALLDTQMPVSYQPSPINVPHLVKFKLLYILAAAIMLAVIFYFALHHPVKTKTKKHHQAELKKDSVTNINNIKTITTGGVQGNDPANVNSSTQPVSGTTDKNNTGVSTAPGSTNGGIINIPAAKPDGGIHISHSTKNASANTAISNTVTGNRNSTRMTKPKYRNHNLSSDRSASAHKSSKGNHLKEHRNHPDKGNTRFMSYKYNDALSMQDAVGKNEYSTLLQSSQPKLNFGIGAYSLPTLSAKNKIAINSVSAQAAKGKDGKAKNAATSKLDWGILAGVNLPGSFTPKSQNANFYGSLPVDAFGGLFATYNFTDKWGVNLQLRFLNPHLVSGSYTHANQSKVDTAQTLRITDSRKIYTADVPLHLLYRITKNINIKAGAVISFPLKQANASSTFQTGKSRKDTSGYYNTVTTALNNTGFEKKVIFGLSGGIGFNIKRLSLDVESYKSLQTQNVSSALGSYTSGTNGLQITVGFKLNKLIR